MNKKLIRKMLTAAGGPLRIKFTPEQIALFESYVTRVPGMNNSGGNRYREEGVLALQHLEQEVKKKEEEIKSRMEMRPTLKRKATVSEKLRGKKDEYKQVPLVVGMSGADPVGEFILSGIGLGGIGTLAKTGAWGTARLFPTSYFGNLARLYFVGNTFKNSFNGAIPTLTSQTTSLLHPTKYNISDNITLYRANPTNIKNLSYKGERYGDTSGLYVGKWFTDEPSKPNWYASNMAKRGEDPAYYLVTVPRYWAKKQKASHKISNPNIEYEPEDYIIEDGINGLQGLLYQGRPGTIQYLLLSFLTPIMKEPSTSLKFFERKLSKPKQPTEHVQGDEAVKMFKEYGGEPIPEGSINGELLRKYVAEARERYGLTNNRNITDEEIAQALYKHSKELGGNTAAVNAQGEPLLLFRGDTKAYTELRNNHHESGGTEDNILGTLFLDRTGIGEGWGPDRYLYLSNKNGLVMAPYRTGIESESFSLLKPKFKDGYLYDGFGKGYISDKQISYPYWSYTGRSGETIQGNKIASDNFADGTVNHLNAFIVRTPSVRDITNEVVVTGGKPGTPPPFNWLIPKESRIGHDLHDVRLALNKAVVEEAKKHNQGLLKSDRGSYWRGEEHEDYDYFALPDFNIQGAKHLLPYDLRIPRNWKDKNIYRGLIPLAGGYTLYNIFNQPLQQLQYLKQGGKMNIIEFLKKGSGIHIKKKNRGKFTSYCGGKVTDECIRKAKSSGNPTLVKRATFAANARKWKHEEGGIIKAADGAKTNTWLKIGNALNNGWGLFAINGIESLLLSRQYNKALSDESDIAKAELDREESQLRDLAKYSSLVEANQIANLISDPNNPNSVGGDIIMPYILSQLLNYKLFNIKLKSNQQRNQIDLQAKLMKDLNNLNTWTSIILTGLGTFGTYLNNKNDNSQKQSTSV